MTDGEDLALAYICSLLGLAVIVTIVTCYCMRKKKVKRGKVLRSPQPTPAIAVQNAPPSTAADVVTRYERSVSNHDVYIVPFSALPPNFDYSSPGVEVRGDFVILRNLSLLDPHTDYEAYRQLPYNPNVPYYPYNQNSTSQYNQRGNPPPYTPSLYPNVTGEAYQKQAAYNPGYVEQ